jgi:hypothetical protein
MFREERLLRSTWEKVCFSQGRANAYIDYHWRHEGKPAGFTAVSKGKLGLWKRTALSRTGVEGISAQDMDFFAMLGYRHQFTKMRGAPRNYERFGLVRLDYKG